MNLGLILGAAAIWARYISSLSPLLFPPPLRHDLDAARCGGVVLLEVLTGRHPLDPSLPGGLDLMQLVRGHLQRKLDPVHLLDGRLLGRPEHQLQEMLQALSISVLCVSHRPDDRPAIKDMVALLEVVSRPMNDEQTKDPAIVSSAACPVRNVTLQGSLNCSFAMSEYSS